MNRTEKKALAADIELEVIEVMNTDFFRNSLYGIIDNVYSKPLGQIALEILETAKEQKVNQARSIEGTRWSLNTVYAYGRTKVMFYSNEESGWSNAELLQDEKTGEISVLAHWEDIAYKISVRPDYSSMKQVDTLEVMVNKIFKSNKFLADYEDNPTVAIRHATSLLSSIGLTLHDYNEKRKVFRLEHHGKTLQLRIFYRDTYTRLCRAFTTINAYITLVPIVEGTGTALSTLKRDGDNHG